MFISYQKTKKNKQKKKQRKTQNCEKCEKNNVAYVSVDYQNEMPSKPPLSYTLPDGNSIEMTDEHFRDSVPTKNLGEEIAWFAYFGSRFFDRVSS